MGHAVGENTYLKTLNYDIEKYSARRLGSFNIETYF